MTAIDRPAVPMPRRNQLIALIAGALALASPPAAWTIAGNWGKRAEPQVIAAGPIAPPQVARPTSTALRSDKVNIALGGSGQRVATDYLVRLSAGDAIAYSWTATAPVAFELHSHNLTAGDKPGDQITYFGTGSETSANGYLVAPSDGFYGWYFQPKAGPAEVSLGLTGFYLPTPGLHAVP